MSKRSPSFLAVIGAAALISTAIPAVLAQERIVLTPQETQWEECRVAARATALAAKTTMPPKVDGALDDAAWREARPAGAFADYGGVPEEAKGWVEMRAAYDAEALYFGARLAKPGPALRATIRENGAKIWFDDALELFLVHPDTGARYQIDVNALGAYWAGADAKAPNWSPAIRCAAVVGERDWTVELRIPWADLGVRDPGTKPLGFQMRYLVGAGAGSVTWTAGLDPKDYGQLAFHAEQRQADMARPCRFLFPRMMPAGANKIGVEFENPSDQPRKVYARLHNYKTNLAESNASAEVPPKSRMQLFLTVTVPETDVIERTLLAMDRAYDPTGSRYQLQEARRMTAMPALDFALDREKIWRGDAAISGALQVGLPEPDRASGRLRVALWDEVRRIEEKVLTPIAAGRYALSLKASDLPAGAYRLVVSLDADPKSRRLISDLNVDAGAQLPDRQKVRLMVNWPENTLLADAAPLYAGLSFPGGQLMDPENVRIVNGRGDEVPCQSEILTRWGPEGSVRWLGLYFQGSRGEEYSAEFGQAVKRAEVRGRTLDIKDGKDAITVDTGAARFELPKSGPLFGPASVGGKPALAGQTACLLLADQNGRAADETHGTMEEAPVVELAGPLHAVIRREGFYKTAAGERMGKYVVRLTFDAGMPFVRVQHTFINTEDSNKLQYSDIALRVKPAFGGPWQAALDDSPAHDAKSRAVTLDPKAGDAAYLLQSVYKHHGQPEKKFEIGLRRGTGNWEKAESGETAGDWASVSGGGVGAAWTIRNLALLFPKEIEINSDGITAHLWSSRGGRNLDYRASTLVDYWGEKWVAEATKYGHPMYPAGGAKGFRDIRTNAAGSARTHDLCLHLFTGAGEQVPAVAQIADQPVLAIQDPAWLNATDALGPVHPYDPQRFPRAEQFAQNFMKELIAGAVEGWGDYGFLDYGSGPHTYRNGGHPAKNAPTFYRYDYTEYQFRTTVWLMYARSGERMYFDYADAKNRHIGDFHFTHWENPGRPLGSMLNNVHSQEAPLYWSGGNYITGEQGQDLDNLYCHFYLAGDRRALDDVKLFGEYFAQRFDPLTLPNVGAGYNHMPYTFAAELYRHTWDERFGKLLRTCRERLIDLRTTTTLVDQDYYSAFYKTHTRLFATLKDWQVTGSALARRALVKALEHELLTTVPDGSTGYQDHSGLFANYGYRLTGDARYASWFAERLGRLENFNSRPTGEVINRGTRSVPYEGPWSPNFLESLSYGMDLVARAEKDIRPWPAVSAQGDLYFIKEPHVPLTFEVISKRGTDLVLTALRNKEDAIRRDYFVGPVHFDALDKYFSTAGDGLQGGTARITVPVEALPGEYRLTEATALWTDAPKLVLSARDGATLPVESTRPRRWFFLLPKGKSGAFFASAPTTLKIDGGPLDPAQGRTLTASKGAWLDLAGETEDRVVTVEPQETAYVRFKGDIPAVLAENDASRFFLPQGDFSPSPVLALEDPKGVYVAGVTGADADKAALLNGARALTLPVGRKTGERVFERLDWNRGTLEFWFKPQWSSRMESGDSVRHIFTLGPCSCMYVASKAEGNYFYVAVPQEPGHGQNPQLHRLYADLEQGRWYHLAYCWETDPKRGWLSELYLDGKGTTYGKPVMGLGRFNELFDKSKDWQVRNVQAAAAVLQGAFNAAVDEVRISGVPRYPGPFDPPPRKPFETDAHALLLLHLNGDTTCVNSKADAPAASLKQ